MSPGTGQLVLIKPTGLPKLKKVLYKTYALFSTILPCESYHKETCWKNALHFKAE